LLQSTQAIGNHISQATVVFNRLKIAKLVISLAIFFCKKVDFLIESSRHTFNNGYDQFIIAQNNNALEKSFKMNALCRMVG
jgi:uncharacterized protein (DUF486 family)